MAYDEKMHFYNGVVKDIASLTLDRRVQFAMLHMGPLARSLQENAGHWVMSLGKLLNDSARDHLMTLDRQLDVNIQLYVFIGYFYPILFIFFRICLVI